MKTLVLEHVLVAELPPQWRVQLTDSLGATVTVRIEEEEQATAAAEVSATVDPAFGIWRDRSDMDDVAAYVRSLRQPRYRRDGARTER